MTEPRINFDRAAEFYDDTRGFPPQEETPIAALIVQAGQLTSQSRVLEIGIGTGRIALPVARQVQAVHGIDISRLMMQRLQAKRQNELIYPIEADANRLPYATASFDAAIVVHVFHLLPDLPAVLAELARVLRPGGFLLNCWNEHNSPLDKIRDERRITRGESPRRNPSHHHTQLIAAGWQQRAEYQHTFMREQIPLTLLENFKRRVWSSLWNLTDAELEQDAACIEKAIYEQFADPSAPIWTEETFHVAVYKSPQFRQKN